MTESASEPDRQQGSRRGSTGFAIGVLLILAGFYLLSPLPIIWLDKYDYIPDGLDPVMEIYFAPLAWLYNNVPAVQVFYNILFKLIGIDHP